MIRQVTLILLVSGLAACASSGPQDSGMSASNSAESTKLVASVEPTEAPEIAPATDGEAVIDFVEAPEVEKTALAEPPQRDDVICRRERVTGSHRTEKVCRSRAESRSTRDETHESLREAARRTGSSANSN